MERDFEHMLFCDVCGADACFGFGVTLDGLRIGDVGSWRCADHHPDRTDARFTRSQWDMARTAGELYPSIVPAMEPS